MKDEYPDSITLRVLPARTYLADNNQPAAIAELEQAMLMSPGNTSAGLILARLSSLRGDIEKAKSIYASIIERYPSNVRALIESARLSLVGRGCSGSITSNGSTQVPFRPTDQ